MIEWHTIDSIPMDRRVLVWVVGKILPGIRFGSAYPLSQGFFVARPEGANGDWTKDITHWAEIPEGPKP